MSGSTTSSFGSGPVGSSVQPCPLGTIEVEVARSDGATPGSDVRVTLTGPDALDGTVPDGTRWLSPKIRPGSYRIEIDPSSTPRGWQPGPAVTCQLPTSGAATARLVLRQTATVPVRVVRQGSGAAVADVTVTLSQPGSSVEGITAGDGVCRLVELPTADAAYRVEITLAESVASRYEPVSVRDITVVPGSNQEVVIELAPMAEITVEVVDPDSTNRRTVDALVTATASSGQQTEVATGTDGKAVFTGLSAGKYDITAVPGPDSGYVSIGTTSVDLARGAEKSVELTAVRARSRIVMSDKATREAGGGLLWNMLAKPYPVARDEIKARFNRNATVLLPFSQLEFDDLYFDPDDAYHDDGRESIAITGWADFHGIRRQLLFAHTYRPNRLILAVKRKQWSFDKDWIRALANPLTSHLSMEQAFLVLSASETSIKSADLPPGVSSFFADEDIDLKQGVNLYGNLDIRNFPKLETVMGWLGFKDQYLKIQGWLGHDASFAISKEAIEKQEVHERAWELGLSGTVPWRIPASLEWAIKERELTLEITASREMKGHAMVRKKGSEAPKAEKKIGIKLEDAITIPLPTLAIPWLVVVNEDKDVEFTGALLVEHEIEDGKAGVDKTKPAAAADGEEKTEISLEYGTDFTIALFGKNLAVHDIKAELNFTSETLKISGEFDLGRREKVAVVELERKIGDGKSDKPKAKASDKSATTPAGDVDLPVVESDKEPALPPKPSLNLEEKASKPQPEAPTEEELAAASSGSPAPAPAKPAKANPWSVTVKLKPSVVMGLVDIIRDIADHLKSHRSSS